MRLAEIPGVGHAPSLVEPEALAAIRQFLRTGTQTLPRLCTQKLVRKISGPDPSQPRSSEPLCARKRSEQQSLRYVPRPCVRDFDGWVRRRGTADARAPVAKHGSGERQRPRPRHRAGAQPSVSRTEVPTIYHSNHSGKAAETLLRKGFSVMGVNRSDDGHHGLRFCVIARFLDRGA